MIRFYNIPYRQPIIPNVTRLLEVYVYGEGQTNDKAKNLRGQVYKIYDGAGVAETPDYDFKGNPLIQKRTYTEDATQHPDWTSIGSVNLETETYDTATEYDALNRPVKLTTPDDGETKYTYDKGGLLKTVEVENVHSLDTEIVNNIEYDAKGQRTKVQYENGTTTTYEYDEFTFRVRRIRTTRHNDSKELQDLRYWYDPVGNVTLQKDLAQQTVYFDGSVADAKNDYTYDALYRLIQAEGREHAGNNNAPDYNDNSRRGITPVPIASADTAKMRRYTQHYAYDEVGNFITMQHTVAGGTGNWTRYYTTANNSNRLQSTKIGTSGTPETYTYDNRGNIVSGFIHLQSLTYNAENRLEKVEIDANRTAYYQYDNAGQRVRKTIIDTNSNITEVRKYVGEWEVYSKSVSSTLTLERETLHISDDTGRIALIDTRTTGTGAEPAQLLRYQYSNHLGTATLELDDAGAIISYEEYFSYGSTSFQSGRSLAEVSLKRFKYCSCERDEESGLYSMGARLYICWLARWTAVDMLQSEMPTWSSYNYGFCNPVVWKDSTGMQPEEKDPPQTIQSGSTRLVWDKEIGDYTLREVVVTAQRIPGIYNTRVVEELLGNTVDNTKYGTFQVTPEMLDNIAAYKEALQKTTVSSTNSNCYTCWMYDSKNSDAFERAHELGYMPAKGSDGFGVSLSGGASGIVSSGEGNVGFYTDRNQNLGVFTGAGAGSGVSTPGLSGSLNLDFYNYNRTLNTDYINGPSLVNSVQIGIIAFSYSQSIGSNLKPNGMLNIFSISFGLKGFGVHQKINVTGYYGTKKNDQSK